MREAFQRGGSFGGTKISANWVNRVNRAMKRQTMSVPGSTANAVRGMSFEADQPFPKTIIQRYVVQDFLRPDPVPTPHPVPANYQVGVFTLEDEPIRIYDQSITAFTDEFSYLGSLLKYGEQDETRDESEAKPWKFDPDQVGKRIDARWHYGQFYVPRRPNRVDVAPSTTERQGDTVEVVYDYVTGRFQNLYPITQRPAVAITDVYRDEDRARDLVDVQVWSLVLNGGYQPVPIVIKGVRVDWCTSCPNVGDQLFIELFDGLWHVTCADGIAKKIHFRLEENLQYADASAKMSIRRFFDGADPEGVLSASELLVYNDEAGCGPGLHRFQAGKGCNGQAEWDCKLKRYWIYQLDCVEDDEVDDESSCSCSESSSSSSSAGA